jgi:hypothetical protein
MLRCPLRFLLKSVQDNNQVGKRGHIDDAERAGSIPNPDFADAPANRRHRFPVIRFETALNTIKLVAGTPPRGRRKRLETSEGITGEFYQFQRAFLYQNRYKVKAKSSR